MNKKDYNSLPELLSEDIIKRVSALSTAQLCDGMEGLGVVRNGCMDGAVMPIESSMRMVGTACTVETEDGDNFPIHVAIYQGKPGYVLVVDGKGYTERTYMGDLMTSAAKAIGFNGIVIDGFVRDREGLKELELPVFSRGIMQRTPTKKGPGKINVPVTCGGITVNPGDLVMGDYDGITVIPRERILEVLEKAEGKNDYELKRRETIEEYARCKEQGKELPNIAPAWVTEMLGNI
ncbi:RraA family protein [Anaerocolumna sp.]|uniref:RraA family protein n=1 Tax=Anaerocolumna sp. TaxID=2041569 RepID=UPI0028B00712|nr:RraA family protein [Anaerocolumna sp.]